MTRLLGRVQRHSRGDGKSSRARFRAWLTAERCHGIYFKELKLTPEGERAAISHRKQVEDFKKKLPEIAEYADSAAAEVDDFERKIALAIKDFAFPFW